MGNGRDREEDQGSAGKPQNGRFRDTARRLRQGKEAHLSHRASLDWRLDQRGICEKGAPEADIVTIAELMSILMKSRTADALLSCGGVQILHDRQVPCSQYYPVKDGGHVVTLNPLHPKGDLINMLSRELRRAWQHRQGALVNPLMFEPDEAILVNRAQTADALVTTVRIAWELKLAGENDAWEYLTASPMGDVSRIFETRAQTDFRTLNNGEAARAAYDKFFEDSRTKQHDKRVIHQMLLDEQGYIKSMEKRPRVSLELFQKLGELPEGRNYLAIRGKRLPTDMCYATVEDRSNANFLWFIKFERSFQEKELKMMQESVKLSAEIVDFTKWSLQARRGPVNPAR
jgi:hypothetical protein